LWLQPIFSAVIARHVLFLPAHLCTFGGLKQSPHSAKTHPLSVLFDALLHIWIGFLSNTFHSFSCFLPTSTSALAVSSKCVAQSCFVAFVIAVTFGWHYGVSPSTFSLSGSNSDCRNASVDTGASPVIRASLHMALLLLGFLVLVLSWFASLPLTFRFPLVHHCCPSIVVLPFWWSFLMNTNTFVSLVLFHYSISH
jgi:hypothetical protein